MTNKKEINYKTLIHFFVMLHSVIMVALALSIFISWPEAKELSFKIIAENTLLNITTKPAIILSAFIIFMLFDIARDHWQEVDFRTNFRLYLSACVFGVITLNMFLGFITTIENFKKFDSETDRTSQQMPATEKLASEIINGSKLYIFSKEAK
ncbi:hypothetical protein [Pseudomonas sp. HY7a-MNA-CIBAN-0227]|uniref:hypothetical protein n=1 Tax=Pseudomonas sp. HY7a-MNA-CIBAN-0227 TaxID=3140474 RepID=UPI00332B6510